MAEEVTVTIDLNNLKLKNREIFEIERVTGMAFADAFQDGKTPTWLASQALGWVLAVRSIPDLTWEEVIDQDVDSDDNPYKHITKNSSVNPTLPAKKKAGSSNSKK